MKLSIFTTITRPDERGDNWLDALRCYSDLADELVIVDGGNTTLPDEILGGSAAVTLRSFEWTELFNWSFIGSQFQRGYDFCAGDWVIHADIDWIFHERDFQAIRRACEQNPEAPALSFWKYQFILPDRYNLKSRLVIAVNKGKYGSRIRFNGGGDKCQPTLDSKYIDPDDIPEAGIPFYNYEKMTKTKHQIVNDANRMEDAYFGHFGRVLYEKNGKTSYEGMTGMMVGRFNKPQKEIPFSDHPKYVQDTIRNLEPHHWGYNGFGRLPINNYVEGVK